MKITDNMLREAAPQVREAFLASLPEPEDCVYEFSPSFERRIEVLIKKRRRLAFSGTAKRVARRAAAVLLAVLVGAGTWLTVDTQAREAVFQWVRETWENRVVYRFGGEQTDAFPDYRPTWVPEGYEETESFDGHAQKGVTYENTQGDAFYFGYMPMQEGSTQAVVLEEGVSRQTVSICGLEGDFYQSQGPEDYSNLIWIDEENNLAFSIDGFLEKDVMVHIAESIILCHPTK